MKLAFPFLARLRRPVAAPVHLVDLGEASGPVYAVGDVHGCSALLRRALAGIAQDAAAFKAPPTTILLGDLIDRGPDSAGVLDLLGKGGAGSGALNLLGNHERMMLSFAHDPMGAWDWLALGGFETLRSYGLSLPPSERGRSRRVRQMVAAHVPDAHLDWLARLPHGYRLRIGGRDHVFTHAGLEPGLPLDAQTEAAVLWGRNGAGAYPGLCVVQGHVVVPAAQLSDELMRIDTGAWTSGNLTVLRLSAGMVPSVLSFDIAPSVRVSTGESMQGPIEFG